MIRTLLTRLWLRQTSALIRRTRRRIGTIRRILLRPRLEQLEDRTTPATITWDGGAGTLNWGDAANWDGNVLPGSGDDVVIPDLPGSLTITYATGETAVASIQTAETLSITGGTLINAGHLGGTGLVRVDGGTFQMSGTDWVNSAAIDVVSGTLDLGGSFTTAGIGTISRTGGTISITGSLDNSGSTLSLDSTIGSWNLTGTISGGTIDIASGQALNITGNSATLSHVATVNGAIDLGEFDARPWGSLTVIGDLELNGSLYMGRATRLYFDAASTATNQQLTGTATITMHGTSGSGMGAVITQTGAIHTVTFGSGISITASGDGNSIGSGGDWVNQGTIGVATAPSGDAATNLLLSGSSWTNHGTILANAPDSTVDMRDVDSLTNASGAILGVAGGTFYSPSSWTNAGQFRVGGGTAHLQGLWTQSASGSVDATGGVVMLTGTIHNTGSTLDLGADTTWYLNDTGGTGGVGVTIEGGTITAPVGSTSALVVTTTKTIQLSGGVTLNAPLDLSRVPTSKGSATVRVTGGLTVNSTITMGDNSGVSGTYAFLQFDGSQTLAGNGEIVFGTRSGGAGNLVQVNAGDVLTIGPGLTIRGTAGTIGTNSGGATIINQGTIRRDSGEGQFTISLGNNGRNEGLIDTTVTSTAVGSQTVITAGSGNSWTNTGTITSSGVLILGFQPTESWSNTGTISATGGIVQFRGQVTQAAIGNLSRTANTTVRIVANGVLSGDVHLDDTTGSWQMYDGTYQNGTLTTSGSARLYGSSQNSLLSNVTINGMLDLSGFDPVTGTYSTNVSMYVENGITLNTTLQLGSPDGSRSGDLAFRIGPQTLAGTGTIVFGKNTSNDIVSFGVPGALMIAPTITIRGHTGRLSGFLPLVNQGTIHADLGGTITVNFGPSGRNDGTIQATGGSSVVLEGTSGGTWLNSGTVTIEGGGTLQLGSANQGESWSNAGIISSTDSTVDLRAKFTQASLGKFTRSGGTVRIGSGGTLTGGLVLDDTTGSWVLANGTSSGGIVGGRITTSGSAKLIATNLGGILRGVTLDGTLDATSANARVDIHDGLTLHGTILLGNDSGSTSGKLQVANSAVSAPQVIRGSGTIVFGASNNNMIAGAQGASSPVAFPKVILDGVTVRGRHGTIGGNTIPELENRGTIWADAPDINGLIGGITVNPTTFTNLGTVAASGGGTVTLASNNHANLTDVTLNGTVYEATLTGGDWSVSAGSTLRLYYGNQTSRSVRLTHLNAAVTLDGAASNIYGASSGNFDALGNLIAIDGDGSLTLTGGRSLVAASDFTNAGQLVIGAGSTLTQFDATGTGSSTLTQTGGRITIQGGTLLTDRDTINLQGGTLGGVGTIPGNVINNAVVSPGNSPGLLIIDGDYTQDADGVLHIEMAGRNGDISQGPLGYDRIRVNGTATLGGTLQVELLDDFQPTPGDEFFIIEANNSVGQFASLELPAPGGALRQLRSVYDPVISGVPKEGFALVVERVLPFDFGYATTAAPMSGIFIGDAVMDAAGNTYVAGTIDPKEMFDLSKAIDFDRERTYADNRDLLSWNEEGLHAFLVKYSPAGEVEWIRTVGRSGTTPGASAEVTSFGGIALDSRGNSDPADDLVYLTGSFSGTIQFTGGGPTFSTTEIREAFLFQIDSEGNYQAHAHFGGDGGVPGTASGQHVAVDGNGHVFVAVDFGFPTGTGLDADPGAGTYSIQGLNTDTNVAIIQLDSSLGFVRANALNSSDNLLVTDLAVSPSGKQVYVVGELSGTVRVGWSDSSSGQVEFEATSRGSNADGFFIYLEPNGQQFKAGGWTYGSAEGLDLATSVAVDSQGNILIGGQFEFSVDFDVHESRAFTLTSAGDSDGFVVKLTPVESGVPEFAWARQVGGYRGDVITRVAFDAVGGVYAAGLFSDVVDFDPLDGSYLLQSQSPGDAGILGNPSGDGFVWKLDEGGRFVWAAQYGTMVDSEVVPTGLAVGASGRVVTVGNFEGTVDFDPTSGTANRSPEPNPGGGHYQSAFVTSLVQKDAPVVEIGFPPPWYILEEGTTVSFTAQVSDADSDYFTYAWTLSRDGSDIATGAGPLFTVYLADQGFYTVTVVVRDETGLSATQSKMFGVSNVVPQLNATAYDTSTVVLAGVAGDNLGTSIVVEDNLIVMGAPLASGGGQVQAYWLDGLHLLTANAPAAGARYGESVAYFAGDIIIGAPGLGTGEVHIYESWTGDHIVTLTAPNGDAADQFGATVTVVGGLVLVGAPGRPVGGAANAGEAYLFDLTTRTLLRTLRNPTPQAGDRFGAAAATAGGLVLIGAPGDDTGGLNAGAVYVIDPGTGKIVRTLLNPNGSFVGSEFGSVIATSGLRAAVGAPLDDSAGTDAGGVYLFDLDPASAGFGTLVHTFRSPAASPTNGKFGTSIDLTATRLLVGAESDGGSGSVYLFDADSNSPSLGTSLQTFKKSTPVAGDRFGAAVALYGNEVYVGAPSDASGDGAVYHVGPTAFLTVNSTSFDETGTLTVSGSFNDPGASDNHTLFIDWADGTRTQLTLAPGESRFSASRQYLDDDPSSTSSDTYTVRVRVQETNADVLAALLLSGNDQLVHIDGLSGSSLRGLKNFSGVAGADQITGMAIGPDELLYVAFNGGGNPVVRYDPATLERIDTFIANGPTVFDQSVNNLVFGPNGLLHMYADGPNGRYIQRYDRYGQPVAGDAGGIFDENYDGDFDIPQAFNFGPDGRLYVGNSTASGPAATGEIRVYDGVTGQRLANVPTPAGAPVMTNHGDLLFGPDGSLYVLSTPSGQSEGRVIYQIDPQTGEFLRALEIMSTTTPTHDHILITTDGRLHYSNPNNGTVTSFDLATGESLGIFADMGEAASGGFLIEILPQVSQEVTLTVTNVAPTLTVTAAPNPAGAPAGSYTLEALAADISPLDVLSYNWTITGGTGTPSADGTLFTFTPTGGPITVTLTVSDDDGGTVTSKTLVILGTNASETITVTNPAADINKVIVFALDGDDMVNASAVTTVPVELIGGSGNDTLIGGSKDDILRGNNLGDYDLADPYSGDTGFDSLVGGAGNDTLDGGLGNDTMAGGAGNDTYIQVPGSADLLTEVGGNGIDTIDYRDAFSGISFSLAQTDTPQVVNPAAPSSEQHTVEIRGQFENLTGSRYADQLRGNDLDNVLNGGDGDDLLFGGDSVDTVPGASNGNDTIVGGRGSDTVYAGSGHDIIFGGDPVETVSGVSGHDVLVGGTGDDTVIGSAGNDIIFGGDEVETVAGVSGNDLLIGGGGSDTIRGGFGNDIIFGGDPLDTTVGATSSDSLIGGAGDDTIIGGAGNDIIFGGDPVETTPGASGNDSINGGAGHDTIYGGRGISTILGGSGNDIIFGGDPVDTVSGSAGGSLLIGGTGNDTIIAGAGNDIIFGGDEVETAPGASGNDSLIGGIGNDTIYGGGGNDIIFGGDPVETVGGVSGHDVLIGGAGSDTVVGAGGNDIIFGGDVVETVTGAAGNDLLIGGGGNDTITGGAGNDIIFGGDVVETLPGAPNDDVIYGGAGNDTIYGGFGNDIIFGGDALDTLPGATSGGDDSIIGGAGNDTIYGGSGNDIIFGGDVVETVAGASGHDLLNGGTGNDTLIGGAGNDILYGGAGNDVLSGGKGIDSYEGGSEYDQIIESADANFVLGTTTLTIGDGSAERFYDIEAVSFTGGVGDNLLDASAFNGPVTLIGGGGNDTLIGTQYSDSLVGGSGDDSLIAGEGDDVLDLGDGSDFADGGAGNDSYRLRPGGSDVLIDSQGIDWVDLSSSAFAVTVDLSQSEPQVIDSAGSVLTLTGAAFENVRGSSFNDTLKGSGDRNILEGAGGIDRLEGGDGDDVVRGGFPQVVYLDFVSATGPGEHFYTIEERNQIQALLERDFGAPFTVIFTQNAPATGTYTTLVVNAGGTTSNDLLAGGVADELDWRNVNSAARAFINVNTFLGRVGQLPATSQNYVLLTATVMAHELGHLFGLRHTNSLGPIGINPETGLVYGIYEGLLRRSISKNETVAGQPAPAPGTLEFTLAYGPVLLAPTQQQGNTQPNAFVMPHGTLYVEGVAVATFNVTESGAMTFEPLPVTTVPESWSGSVSQLVPTEGLLDPVNLKMTLHWSGPLPASAAIAITYHYEPLRPGFRGPDDAFETPLHITSSPASTGSAISQAAADTYFGERELIKLSFADASTTYAESALPTTPSPLGEARVLGQLPAIAVPNLLPEGAVNYGKELVVRAGSVIGSIDSSGERDYYVIEGKAGDLLNIEVLSQSLRARIANTIDSTLRVYDSSGQLLNNYHGQPAFNDDGIENGDAILIDLQLPEDGIYYIEVGTFGPGDLGGYELFVYSYSPLAETRLGGAGDVLIGGAGADVLVGSTGDDRFIGSLSEGDVFLGLTPFDLFGELNNPPVVSVELNTESPQTNDVLVATAVASDPDDDPVTLTFVWKVNGQVVRTEVTTELTDSFDLSLAGERGDTVTVEVTAHDGEAESEPAIAGAIVGNSDPEAGADSFATNFETELIITPLDLLENDSDVDFDVLTVTGFTQPTSGGSVSLNDDGYLVFTPATGFSGWTSFTYTVSDGHGGTTTGDVELYVRALPVVTITGASTELPEGATIDLGSQAEFVESDDFTLAWTVYRQVGDEFVVYLSGHEPMLTFTPTDHGVYRVVLALTDGFGQTGQDEVLVQVANVAPTLSVSGAARVNEGQQYTVTLGSVVDPGADTVSAYIIHWGDGQTSIYDASNPLPEHRQVAHTYADGTSSYTIEVDLVDEDGTHSAAGSHSVLVEDVAPALTISGDATVDEGTSYTLNLAAVDPGTDTITGWIINWGDTTQEIIGNPTSVTHIYADGPGEYTITATATNEDGTFAANHLPVVINNVAPTATLVAPDGVEGSPITVSLIDASDVAADVAAGFEYAFDTGSGYGEFGSNNSITIVPGEDGSYLIRAKIRDKDNGVREYTRTITIANAPPVITDISSTGPKVEGSNITVTVAASDPAGANDPLLYEFDFDNDGIYEFGPQISPSASKLFVDDGSYIVHVRVTDGDGGSTTGQLSLQVENLAPTPAIESISTPRLEGTAITATGSATDPGTDSVTLSWAVYKNGSSTAYATGVGSSFGFTPNDNGTYRIVLTANDGEGGTASVEQTISVANVAPQGVTISGPSSGSVGETLTFTGTGSDPAGANDPLTFSWAVYKDGASMPYDSGSGIGQVNYSFTPQAAGTYRVVLTVSDDDNGSTPAEQVVTVTVSAALGVSVSGPSRLVRGQEASFTAAVENAAPGAVTLNWAVYKQGSTTPVATGSGATFNYVPVEDGQFVVRVTATDSANRTATANHALTVRVVDIQPDPLNPGKVALFVGGTNNGDLMNVSRFLLVTDILLVTVITPVMTNHGLEIETTLVLLVPGSKGWQGSMTREFCGVTLDFDLGVMPGSASTLSRIVGYGLGGDDDISVGSTISIDTWLDGGAGHDRLKGGGGNDVLLGGAGDDLLVGGNGRDLLIGGTGSDRILGDAHDDILIAGYTLFDNNARALNSIMKEWTRTNANFATRVSNLTSGGSGALNGSVRLTDQTVRDDNCEDQLTGGSGDDWFFYNQDGENKTKKDKILDLSSFEKKYQSDLDFINGS